MIFFCMLLGSLKIIEKIKQNEGFQKINFIVFYSKLCSKKLCLK